MNNIFLNDGCSNTKERLIKYNLHAQNIKVLDFIPQKEYIKYMQTAHVFLSCSRGEGWNIPLMEAMACGTPAIYSNGFGQLEFAKHLGFYLFYHDIYHIIYIYIYIYLYMYRYPD